MKHLIKETILGLVVILLASSAGADQTLYLVGDQDNKPECYLNESGEAAGSDVEILEELGKRLNLNIKIELTPWVRVLSMIESGKADGGFPLFLTAERKAFALYTNTPVHVSVMTLYTLTNRQFGYKKLSDLYNKSVGINRGYSISKEFDRAVQEKKIKVEEVETIDQLVKMLLDERIDAIAATPSSIESYLAEKNIKLSGVGHVRARAAYLTLSRKAKINNKEKLLDRINQTLLAMKQEGVIKRITEWHLLNSE